MRAHQNQMRGRVNKVTRSILLACMLLACCPCAFALNPALDVSQYAHTAWRVREGFGKGQIYSITQTPDGYLWLGTEFGILRFDGVRSVPWQPPADQPLPSDTTLKLLAGRDGTLWIGTDKGLASWNGKKLTTYPELAGQFIFALLEDRDGFVWAGTLDVHVGKLYAIHNGGVRRLGEDGTFGRSLQVLYEDQRGILWIGSDNGIWQWKPGPPKHIPLGDSDLLLDLAEDEDNKLLVITTRGVKRVVDGKLETHPLLNAPSQFNPRKVLRDRDGSLWIGTITQGMVHVHDRRVDFFSTSQGLTGDDVWALFEDREGNIWIGTHEGLDHFRELAIPTFSLNQGGGDSHGYSILAASEGVVLGANPSGLYRWIDGRFAKYGTSPGDVQHVPLSLFQDSRGRLWGVSNAEFGYLENGRFNTISGIPGGVARSIAEDKHGDLWIANEQVGLFHLRGTEVVEQIPWSKLGHEDFATALAVDPLRGGLWLGFFKGGVAHFSDGQIRAVYGTADGLGSGLVNDFQIDPDGAVWMATAGGLSRLKDNRIALLTTKNGLACNSMLWFREDQDHSYWLYTACGLQRIARTELEKWTAAVDQNQGSNRTIQVTVFDNSDGVRGQIYPTGYSPQVSLTADGKLWLPSPNGVSVVDPRHLTFNSLPPPVHIEQVTADRKLYELTAENNGSLRLPALSHDVEIDYTALSLVAPEKLRFRYKLEGYDANWQDAGNRRQAFYTNLPPRNYRFRVMACNNSGVWNEAGAFLDFAIAPAYYQTLWFRLLLVVAFLSVVVLLYRLRVQQVTQQLSGRMEARVEERERIARDLHDTLIQSVQGLILKFHAVSKQLPKEEVTHEALEQVLDRADEVLAEARDRVRDLRSATETPRDLPAALKLVAEEQPEGREAIFKTVIEGKVRPLHPLVFEEAYSIGREAITNALKHSQGHHIEAEIIYEPRHFRLRVRDDGRGFDPQIFHDGAPLDHFGLRGIQERAERIGAQVSLWSGPDTGTEVELVVPGATAYRLRQDKPRRFWSRRSRD